jgi:hypothetical protein
MGNIYYQFMSGTSITAFLQKSRKVHGDTYDYSEVKIDPALALSKHPHVKIRCKRHNYVFYESPQKHNQYKRYSHRTNANKLPICCHRGNDTIFLNGGFSGFLDKVEELGKTMTRTQISKELNYRDRVYIENSKTTNPLSRKIYVTDPALYQHITKCEKNTGRKIKLKKHASSFDSLYEGKSGLIKTQWGLSFFDNGTETERECKSCHLILTLDKFYKKSFQNPYPRRECKKCWKINKIDIWRKDNPNYIKERRKKDPLFKLVGDLRSGVNRALSQCKAMGTNAVKQDKTLKLLGAESWRHVFDYIESLFSPGMTWQNHGRGNKKKEWHLDHIKPIDYFIKNKDFTLLEVQKECFNLLNLQPLWSTDNLRKSNRFLEVK